MPPSRILNEQPEQQQLLLLQKALLVPLLSLCVPANTENVLLVQSLIVKKKQNGNSSCIFLMPLRRLGDPANTNQVQHVIVSEFQAHPVPTAAFIGAASHPWRSCKHKSGASCHSE
jgi:hypothetical protein